MPSSLVLSVEVSNPAIEVVAAGKVASFPVDDVTVPVDAADVYPRFVLLAATVKLG
jgi:hypothetical protein